MASKMINLDKKNKSLLRKCIQKNKSELLFVLDENEYDYDDEIYNELRDIVCEELVNCGFEEGKPTEYGIELENLIDKIGRLFM